MARTEYTSSNIKILEGLDAVRLRPGMYIGTTGIKGLHHILWEIVDNAVDEAANGYANWVEVRLKADCSASVEKGKLEPSKSMKSGLYSAIFLFLYV